MASPATILDIEGTPTSPHVRLDLVKEQFVIEGRSMPEDSDTFYGRVRQWLTDHLHGTMIQASLDIQLEYYNTGTYIRLMEIFNLLDELNKGGCQLSVRWYYEEDDLDTMDDGNSFKEVVSVPFQVLPVRH